MMKRAVKWTSTSVDSVDRLEKCSLVDIEKIKRCIFEFLNNEIFFSEFDVDQEECRLVDGQPSTRHGRQPFSSRPKYNLLPNYVIELNRLNHL